MKISLSDPACLSSRVWRGIFFLPDPTMTCFWRYVNFFSSRKCLAHEKWAPRPGFSSFPSPAHENQAPSPNFSSSPHPAHENQSHSPSKARFSSLCKPFFTRHALQRSKRIPLRLRRIDQISQHRRICCRLRMQQIDGSREIGRAHV